MGSHSNHRLVWFLIRFWLGNVCYFDINRSDMANVELAVSRKGEYAIVWHFNGWMPGCNRTSEGCFWSFRANFPWLSAIYQTNTSFSMSMHGWFRPGSFDDSQINIQINSTYQFALDISLWWRSPGSTAATAMPYRECPSPTTASCLRDGGTRESSHFDHFVFWRSPAGRRRLSAGTPSFPERPMNSAVECLQENGFALVSVAPYLPIGWQFHYQNVFIMWYGRDYATEQRKKRERKYLKKKETKSDHDYRIDVEGWQISARWVVGGNQFSICLRIMADIMCRQAINTVGNIFKCGFFFPSWKW